MLRFRASNKTCQCRTNSRIEIHPARGGLGTGRAVHSSRVTSYIYMRWSPTYYRWAVPSCPLRVRCNNVIDTMFSPNPAPSTAGSGYTRARTPQGGMSPTALSALFPTATTTEGLTATEVASQTFEVESVPDYSGGCVPRNCPPPPILRLRVQRPRRKE